MKGLEIEVRWGLKFVSSFRLRLFCGTSLYNNLFFNEHIEYRFGRLHVHM